MWSETDKSCSRQARSGRELQKSSPSNDDTNRINSRNDIDLFQQYQQR